MKKRGREENWQNAVQGGKRHHARQKAHTCMVHAEGLIYGYKDQLTEKERRAAMDAKRTFERITNRLRGEGFR